jgi:hypothetical protein
MKIVRRLGGALGLVLVAGSPSFADFATIETTAPLADHSPASIDAALRKAVRTALQGAMAMGFQHVHLRHVVIVGETMVIQLLATDSDADDDSVPEEAPSAPDAAGPGSGPSGMERL